MPVVNGSRHFCQMFFDFVQNSAFCRQGYRECPTE
jgi:hypothetical protein